MTLTVWMLSDIEDRDAQTEQAPPEDTPLGQTGTKYDHARRRTSDYHLDTDGLAMGDRHLLLAEVRARRERERVLADALSFAVKHSLPDVIDGNMRVEWGAWGRLREAIAALATPEPDR